jgi:putative sigma-54 modulation protein
MNKHIQEQKTKEEIMTVKFTARHFEASQQLKDYAYEAVEKLPQYFDRIISCDIVLEPSAAIKKPQKAEIQIKVPNKVLKAEERAEKYEQAISKAVENLARQLKRYKEKKFAH